MKKLNLHSLTSTEAQRSKMSSEEESEEPKDHKYVIRMFKFTKSKEFFSFSPIEKYPTLGLPITFKCKGITYDKKNRFYAYEDRKIVQIPSGKIIKVDKNICFCKVKK